MSLITPDQKILRTPSDLKLYIAKSGAVVDSNIVNFALPKKTAKVTKIGGMIRDNTWAPKYSVFFHEKLFLYFRLINFLEGKSKRQTNAKEAIQENYMDLLVNLIELSALLSVKRNHYETPQKIRLRTNQKAICWVIAKVNLRAK